MSADAAVPIDPTSSLPSAIHALARGADPGAALDAVMHGALDDRGADIAVVLAVDDDRSTLRFVRGLGVDAATLPEAGLTTADLADPLVGAAIERRRVEAVDEAAGAAALGCALGRALGLRRILAEPLVVGRGGIDRAVGVLALGWRSVSTARMGEAGLLEALADLAAVAIDRDRLVASSAERSEWLERLAHVDPLTGLANRRTFDRVLELEIARAGRQGSEVSVAIFDVDAFRATNATAGVAAGDNVLRAVAVILAELVRLVDTVARIGGDEFIIVAPGSGGLAVANRVRAAIEALPPVGGIPVTVSAGVARFPVDGTSAADLLDAALAALAAAKDVGTGPVAREPAAAGE